MTAAGASAAAPGLRAPTVGAGPVLSDAEAPPFRLPGEHFAAALVFLVAGASGLVVVAPDLASGGFLLPRVVAVTHLFTLGWITTSILGALYQFLPVALGESIRWTAVAHGTFGLHVGGVVAFAVGMAVGIPGATLTGAALVGTGLLLFAGNLAATLKRASHRDTTWWALVGADVFLVVTLLLGWALAGNLTWGWLGAHRMLALGVHLHVALLGWVGLVVVGVARKLLPMFLLSHGAGEGPGKAAVGLLTAGVGLLVLLHHAPPAVAVGLPGVLLLAGVAAFLMQARRFYRQRRRPGVDPGMRLAAGGLLTLGLAAALSVPALVVPSLSGGAPSWTLSTAYVALLVLGFVLFVAAHYYKILPFLVWFHRYGPRAGRGPVPRVADLYSARWAGVAGVLLTAGVLALVAAMAGRWTDVAVGAAAVFLAGAVTEALQMVAVARSRPA